MKGLEHLEEFGDKDVVVKEILSSLETFQKELGSVAGSGKFFSSINKFGRLNIEELKKLLLELWERNMQVALQRYRLLLKDLKEKSANTDKELGELNKYEREFNEFKSEDIVTKSKIRKYKEIFDAVIKNRKSTQDNREKLINEGLYRFVKVYLLAASIGTVLYSASIGVISNLELGYVRNNLIMVLMVLGILLKILWMSLKHLMYRT